MKWLYFAFAQTVQLAATLIGYVVLAPFCALHAWEPTGNSIKDNRLIDRWSWGPLNYVYGNPEDGVSGTFAFLWDGKKEVAFMPFSNRFVCSYMWSAVRNSADNLKYVFALPGGTLKFIPILGLVVEAGWKPLNGYNVCVLTITRK